MKKFSLASIISIISILFVTHGAHSGTNSKEVALTFDDCPRKTGILMKGMERAQKLTEELRKSKVPQVAFFCNSPMRQLDGTERLKYFAQQGYLIANHGATHLDLNKVSIDEYIQDIERADRELRDLPNFRKWFRFPFLHEGKTPADVNSIRSFLVKNGYRNGYVTIDNQDWYMDDLLQQTVSKGRKFDQSKLCEVYKKIMIDEAEFYADMSVKALGRPVKHIVLLHETDLNALCISDLISELRAHDWSIISPDVAYTDPIAYREPSPLVKMNQGRIFALAEELGYTGPFWSKWNEEKKIEREFARHKVWE